MSKRFGGVHALRAVDLRLAYGEIHALVGENGAGKSTVAKIIAGAVQPSSGTLILEESPVTFHSPRDALRDGITMIGQELTLVPQLSVLENVFLGSETTRHGLLRRGALRRRYEVLTRDLGFYVEPGKEVGGLRTADQQKVEILRALARDARVVIMDEPTATLTPNESQKLFDIVSRLRDRGVAVMYVSHLLKEVLALADQITILRDGSLVRTSQASEETPRSLTAGMLGAYSNTPELPEAGPSDDAATVCEVQELSRPGAFSDVSFSIRAGEILGLAGLVGSGRTEIARAIFGADKLASGRVVIDGRPIRLRSPRDAKRAGIAMLPESRKDEGLMMERPIFENVSIAHLGDLCTFGVLHRRQELRACRQVVNALDIRPPKVRSEVRALSGGNQQKVLFGRWTMRRPRLLIVDEPTRGVDVGAKQAIHGFLRELSKQGSAILLISSEAEEVISVSHRILVVARGTIFTEFDSRFTSVDDLVTAAFGVPTDAAASVSKR